MTNLESRTHLDYMPVISIHNERRIFFRVAEERTTSFSSNKERGSFNRNAMFQALPETVMDKATLQLIQVEDLHNAIDHTQTAVGSAVLFRSLMQPQVSLDYILAKQDSVRELEADGMLKRAVDDYLFEVQQGEAALLKLLNHELWSHHWYGDFKAARKTVRNILKAAKGITTPETEYARALVSPIRAFESSPIYQMMRGPLYRTFTGPQPKEALGFFTPAWILRPTHLSAGVVGLMLPFFAMTAGIGSGLIERGPHLSIEALNLVFGTLMASMGYGSLMKEDIEYNTAIAPLIKRMYADKGFNVVVDAVGKLDELRSFIEYARALPHAATLPSITDGDAHYFIAQNLRNQVLGKGNYQFVPNDVQLNGSRLTFITGPNSGGKTTYCKSILQNQLLGQIGGYVLASKASMNVADRIAYQAPQFDALQDAEGRFGTELARTRDIFYETCPQSLVVLDELAEGTTIEEKIKQSHLILNGFHAIGNNTILVTHTHQLVDSFRELGKGQYLQAEFNETTPTYRMVQGTSRESHAERVAEKIGFSEQDIQQHLMEKGYLKP